MASTLVLLINLIAVCVYGYCVYHMNYNPTLKKMSELIPPPLRVYGLLKFLTYQCLLIQLLNAILHVGAHFSRALEKPRDLIFTTLAYPIGSIVVYSFWAVWHILGREYIFPVALSQFYPDWLNHATHTITAPLNILMAILVHHKYNKNGLFLTIVYFGIYTAFLQYIKIQTGISVYKYLDTMSDLTRMVYFASTGLFVYLMYKSGQYMTTLLHQKAAQRPVLKKQKQK